MIIEQEKEMIRELFQKLIIHCENHHGVMLNISTKHLEIDINKLLSEYKIEEIWNTDILNQGLINMYLPEIDSGDYQIVLDGGSV